VKHKKNSCQFSGHSAAIFSFCGSFSGKRGNGEFYSKGNRL
jgi:hypothetical protein